MKIFKSALVAIFAAVAITGCSKSGDSVDKPVSTPLIKALATTTRNFREIFNYGYDDQKRLISTSYNNASSNIAFSNPITYNLGGFQIINTSEANKRKVMDFNLEDGHIKTANYNVFFKDVNQNLPVSAAFSYDSKGRLIKILQTIALNASPPYPTRILVYTFTWDDNDNLTGSNVYDQNTTPDKGYKIVYSGFSTENVNTLSAKNFGFDYFGTSSYTGQFYPSGDGSSGAILPLCYPGKTLPSRFTIYGTVNYNVVYHKNAQGYIDRIEQTNVGDANDYYYLDVAYQ
ncbi:hypothetical protein [Mucilaginibacter flavus]|uniref:hypothetical protein n=1 Tax=Mucilaginibacter flavus TaxID=931504 RepID=UPI0025B2F308|nr:hypothetical protein [Mucilaginibacter flavus]MDN3581535.1 hypothetical protein [Mucilaginibacter flavus]